MRPQPAHPRFGRVQGVDSRAGLWSGHHEPAPRLRSRGCGIQRWGHGLLQYDVSSPWQHVCGIFSTSDSSARPNTSYFLNVDGTPQAASRRQSAMRRLTPRCGRAGHRRTASTSAGALHYYMGATYGRGIGPAGFTTGNPCLRPRRRRSSTATSTRPTSRSAPVSVATSV